MLAGAVVTDDRWAGRPIRANHRVQLDVLGWPDVGYDLPVPVAGECSERSLAFGNPRGASRCGLHGHQNAADPCRIAVGGVAADDRSVPPTVRSSPAATHNARSSAPFAALVRRAVTDSGRTAEVTMRPVSARAAAPGAYIVDVTVDDGPDLLYEVVDWVEDAPVRDPHGEDLTLHGALDYLRLRIMGVPPSEAAQTVLRHC